MNKIVALILLLIATLSTYGQQQIQWYDVSNFAPSVKQCMIYYVHVLAWKCALHLERNRNLIPVSLPIYQIVNCFP